ncbi:MAG TPA: HRDC domain-containing protein [Gemmatimonadaceae bacterium]|nr:HRDC domain-containing protein [Gemmatimonadaceae bacterium]
MHAPTLIATTADAERALRDIAHTREIAVDTEGASFHRFVDRIYLLQLSTRDHTTIVDPLAVHADTLAPLGALLADPAVEVVFHDADYDLRLLRQDYGWQVQHLFDTRVAAQLLGLKAFGLAALLERYVGVRLDKKHQRADWSMRPLPQDMLDYAAQDTMHLLPLRDLMRDELRAKERLEWAREEFARAVDVRWDDEDAATTFFKVKGARDLGRRELAILRELVGWRDTVAKAMDRATFRVVGNEQLLDIARSQPATRDDLGRIKGLSRGIMERRAQEILDAVRRGVAVPEAQLPKFPKSPRWDRDPQFDAKVNALKVVRDAFAERLEMDPGVLASRDRLEAVARKNPRSVDELSSVDELRRWQIDLMGRDFVQALSRVPKK